MTRPEQHLCIATGQNLANLIPALQLGARQVVILETPAMRTAAGNLKRVLEGRDIKVRRIAFDDSSPEAIRKSSDAVAMELGERPLVFNATGGHKLMTLALVECLGGLADDLHVVYAETRHDRLDWLKPEAAMESMRDVLSIDDILRTQGYRRQDDSNQDGLWQSNATESETLTRHMADNAGKLAGFFGALNSLADRALNEDGGSFDPRQCLRYAPGESESKLLSMAHEAELLDWRENEIDFRTREAAAYFRGGWLEEYVWLKLCGLKPHDFAVNLKTRSFGGETENEFDALVAHRNRLLVIECKTSGFGRNQVRDSSYIYKLSQLGNQVGGTMCGKLLLSARPIQDEIRQRAKEYGVHVLAAAEVVKFADFMKQWMREG